MCGGVGLLEGVGKKKANEINVEKDKNFQSYKLARDCWEFSVSYDQ